MGFALIFILYKISSMNKIVDINMTMLWLLNKKFSVKYGIPHWLFEVASQELKTPERFDVALDFQAQWDGRTFLQKTLFMMEVGNKKYQLPNDQETFCLLLRLPRTRRHLPYRLLGKRNVNGYPEWWCWMP